MNKKNNLFPCPCCGQHTISESGTYEICAVCLWEDDPIQFIDPEYEGGANETSLLRAREIFEKLTKG